MMCFVDKHQAKAWQIIDTSNNALDCCKGDPVVERWGFIARKHMRRNPLWQLMPKSKLQLPNELTLIGKNKHPIVTY